MAGADDTQRGFGGATPPSGQTELPRDIRIILAIQGLRAYAYGFAGVPLGVVLAAARLSDLQVGAVLAAMAAAAWREGQPGGSLPAGGGCSGPGVAAPPAGWLPPASPPPSRSAPCPRRCPASRRRSIVPEQPCASWRCCSPSTPSAAA